MPPTQSPNTVRPDKPAAKPGKPIPVVKRSSPAIRTPPSRTTWCRRTRSSGSRYGSNGEPLLSGLSSFVIHAVVIGMSWSGSAG